MAIRFENYHIPDEWKLAEAKVDRYHVIIFGYQGDLSEPCYCVMLDGQKIRAWTSSDERTFPKRAANVGSGLVEAINQQRGQIS